MLLQLNTYSQNDTIVRYFDKYSRITQNQNTAFITDVHYKQSDSLWIYQRFDVFGRLRAYHFTKSKDSKKIIKQAITFDLNDSISSITNYDNNSLKVGKYISWFSNRKINTEGNYIKNKKRRTLEILSFKRKHCQKRIFIKNDFLE
ncbi:MAG: hypothetical protein HC798_03230, partial [Polaribacter sp.]|nr:hypothetical protein [Polaribacter sp.]